MSFYLIVYLFPHYLFILLGKRPDGMLGKRRRQRHQQREHRETKDLMSRTMAVHVRYNSCYISSPFSAKQKREMTKFRVVWRT